MPAFIVQRAEEERQHDEIAVINAMMFTHRAAYAALRAEAPMRLLRLTPGLLNLLGVKSTAEYALYARSGQHTGKRHPRDVPRVFIQLPKSRLAYVGSRAHRHAVRELIFQPRENRPIRMGIKFLPASQAASGQDECWVSTLYFWSGNALRRKLNKNGVLRPVFHSELLTLGEIMLE